MSAASAALLPMLPTEAFASPQPTSPHSVSTRTMVASKWSATPRSLLCCCSLGIGTCAQRAVILLIFIDLLFLARRPAGAVCGS